jgi:mannosyltransferase
MRKIELDAIIFARQDYGGLSTYHKNLLSHSSADTSYLINILGKIISRDELLNSERITSKKHAGRFHEIHTLLQLLNTYKPDPLFRADVVHSTYYRTVSGDTKPLVITAHDFIVERLGVKTIRQKMHLAMKRIALNKAKRVIAISENTYADLEKFYGKNIAAKASVIPHGVSKDFSVDPTLIRRPSVLYVGARAGYKNFDTAVEILANMPSMQLRIIGGPILSKNEERKLNNKLAGRFIYLGNISQRDLIREYNQAKFLLYPSLYEGFGLPPVEAARCGCIPVVFNTSSLPEVVGTAETIFPLSMSPHVIAHELSSMSDYNLDKLRGSGLTFTKKFSWETSAVATEKLYDSI